MQEVNGAETKPTWTWHTSTVDTMPLRGSLHTKMNLIRDDVTYIQKTGKNTQQNYKYATEADTVDSIRKAMIKHGLSLVFSSQIISQRETKNGTPIVGVRLTGAWVDCETGYAEPFEFDGEGMDSGDKAVYKAHTGAEKYLLLKTFLIPTGDDPERDAPEEKFDRNVEESTALTESGIKTAKMIERIKACNATPELDNCIAVFKGEGKNSKKELFGAAKEITKEDQLDVKKEIDKRRKEILDGLGGGPPIDADELIALAAKKGRNNKEMGVVAYDFFGIPTTDFDPHKLEPDQIESMIDWLNGFRDKEKK